MWHETSHGFKNYYSKLDIKYEKKVSNTPQCNGVDERINKIIMEKVKFMLRMFKPLSNYGMKLFKLHAT